jgi:membrane protease YdiL (CAAX protease family)
MIDDNQNENQNNQNNDGQNLPPAPQPNPFAQPPYYNYPPYYNPQYNQPNQYNPFGYYPYPQYQPPPPTPFKPANIVDPGGKGYMSFFMAALLFFALVLLRFANLFAFAFIDMSAVSDLGIELIYFFTMFGGMVLLTFIFCKANKKSFVSVTLLNKGLSASQIVLVVVVAISGMFAFGFFNIAQNLILEAIGFSGPEIVMQPNNNRGLWVTILLNTVFVAIAPAFGEEIIVRGGMQTGFRNKSKLFALMMGSLCFMLLHTNPMQTVGVFLGGVVTAYIVIETKSLWAGILSHFLNNLFAVLITLFLPFLFGDLGELPADYVEPALTAADAMAMLFTGAIMSAIGLSILFAALKGISRRAHIAEGRPPHEFTFAKRLKTFLEKPYKVDSGQLTVDSEALTENCQPSTVNSNNTMHEAKYTKARDTDKKKNALGWLFIGLGLAACFGMWLFVLVAGMMR